MPFDKMKLTTKDRRTQAAKMYLNGKTQNEIAKHFSVTQPTISNDLAVIQKAWLDAAVCDFNEMRARELAKIDLLERTYWEAWDRSVGKQVTETDRGIDIKRKNGEPTPSTLDKIVKIEHATGDPRYLQGVERCIERRCKMFGLDEPERFEHSWRDNLPDGYNASEVEAQFMELIELAAVNDSND